MMYSLLLLFFFWILCYGYRVSALAAFPTPVKVSSVTGVSNISGIPAGVGVSDVADIQAC
jgi:hypothetical protein